MSAAVILFSHGSLLCGAGESLAGHADRLSKTVPNCQIEVGYLNYSEPSFAEAVSCCVENGASKIIVAPYFLVEGFFVKNQLPKVLDPERERFPGISFKIAKAFCDHALLPEAVVNVAKTARKPEYWRAHVLAAADSCQSNDTCPLFETVACPKHVSNEPEIGKQTWHSTLSLTFDPSADALLLMVHGSPRPESNFDVYAVAEFVRSSNQFLKVEVGFMECNAPEIVEAASNCVQAGARRVIAVPYFLHSGRHVALDLPDALATAGRENPQTEFLMSNYLGVDATITKVLLSRIEEAGVSP